jgi:hypothetical protein
MYSIQLFKEFRTAFECPINENFFHLSTEYTKIRSAGENNDSFPIISNPGLFPFKRDNPEKSIDDEIWLTYFSELSTVPPKFDKKIEELNKKVKELEQQPEFKSFSCLGFRISAFRD